MTVAELIEELKKMPQDAEVYTVARLTRSTTGNVTLREGGNEQWVDIS